MKIVADFDSLHDQIIAIKNRVEQKLTGMVQNFSYNLTAQAIDLTPYNKDFEHTKRYYYNSVRLRWGLTPHPGHAKGGWTLSINHKSNNLWNMVANTESAYNVKSAADDASMNYKLGDDIFIVNNVPYMTQDHWPIARHGNGETSFEVKSLESGYSSQAPNGIWGPVTAAAYVYAQDLKRMYDQS